MRPPRYHDSAPEMPSAAAQHVLLISFGTPPSIAQAWLYVGPVFTPNLKIRRWGLYMK